MCVHLLPAVCLHVFSLSMCSCRQSLVKRLDTAAQQCHSISCALSAAVHQHGKCHQVCQATGKTPPLSSQDLCCKLTCRYMSTQCKDILVARTRLGTALHCDCNGTSEQGQLDVSAILWILNADDIKVSHCIDTASIHLHRACYLLSLLNHQRFIYCTQQRFSHAVNAASAACCASQQLTTFSAVL